VRRNCKIRELMSKRRGLIAMVIMSLLNIYSAKMSVKD